MIGLSFLAGIGLWLTVAIIISKKIPHWLGITKHMTAISILLFPLIFAAPIGDDLIGRWQFYRLCDKEALVMLSPDWEKVRRVKWIDQPPKYFKGYFIPIDSQGGQYIDLDTGKIFMTTQSLFTSGGYLQRHFYGLGGVSSCHPRNIQTIQKQVKLFELLKQEEMK